LYAFLISHVCSTRSAYIVFLDLITLTTLANNTTYEAPHYAVFSSFLLFSPT
jgi:hypothetical protein